MDRMEMKQNPMISFFKCLDIKMSIFVATLKNSPISSRCIRVAVLFGAEGARLGKERNTGSEPRKSR